MSDEKNKNYETEWSFSFANLGESISNLLGSLGVDTDAEVETASFSEALDGAESALVTLDLAMGETSVDTLVDSDNLLEAEAAYIGETNFETRTEDNRKMVRLGQKVQGGWQPIKDAFGSFSKRKDLYWRVKLSPNIPLDLTINHGVTESAFDLSGLQLTELKVNGGAGKSQITVPTMGERYHIDLNNGVGELGLSILDGALLDLRVNTGTGKTTISIGANASITAKIAGGVGECVIKLPADAAVSLKASSGIGKIDVPDHFEAVKVDQFVATSGRWETPGFADAENQITLKYDGGVGALRIMTV